MIWITGAVLAVSAAVLIGICVWKEAARRAADGVAGAAVFILFAVASAAVARTIMNGTVFMTEVHSVLENKAFLVSGGYLGPYSVAKLAFAIWEGRRERGRV